MLNKLYQIIKYLVFGRKFHGITSPYRMLPDFIVIGVKRCGTTSLYEQLPEHPDIMNSTQDNVGYFNNNFQLGINYYRSFFPTSWKTKNGKIKTFEVTSSYIQKSKTAKNLFKTLPEIKLILMVRNPIDRAYSEFNLDVKEEEQEKTFEELINEEITRIEKEDESILSKNYVDKFSPKFRHYLRKGMYYEQLQPWLELFKKNQILIISAEEFENETQEIYNKIFHYIGVSKYQIKNTQKARKGNYSKMNDHTRELLSKYFKPHNEKFFELIGRRYDWS